MKFNYTKGLKAKYLVSVYGELVSDQYYFHYIKDAKKLFESICEKEQAPGVSVNIYDIDTDERKAHKRFY